MRAEQEFIELTKSFSSVEDATRFMIKKGIIDPKMYRVFLMRRYYERLLAAGQKKMDALTITAEEYCVSEDTARKAIYYYNDV